MLSAHPDLAGAFADTLRPPEILRPSEWAERYRYLKPGTTHRPGRWSNEVYPYIAPIMDTAQEALNTGKRGIVCMKSGQGAGSEGWLNVWGWLKTYYPGPTLYLISKDEVAKEFGRERFGYMNETCAPLRKLHLGGRGAGELIHIKRYSNGKHVIAGGRSVLNLESTPYRFVFIDEYDSLVDEIPGRGDPLANAEIRVDAFPSQTLIVAFAHPTTRDRNTGKLYYERSDQRRAFAPCFHCEVEFWLNPDRIKVFPHGGESMEKARHDPTCYRYVTPCCEVVLEDAHRYYMSARTEQKSTLPPEEAAKKSWIGVHFSQLYMNNKPLAFLAEKFIEGLESESVMRVVVNKRWGDVYEPAVNKTSPSQWRSCIVIPRHEDDPEAYSLGEVPPGVRFLTAGQDSKADELHWAVWGWGLLRNKADFAQLCGWLVDFGLVELERRTDGVAAIETADLAVMDQLLYGRSFPRSDESSHLDLQHGYHDVGWCPVAVQGFCLRHPGRAIPARGDHLDEVAAGRMPVHRWGPAPKFKVGGVEKTVPGLRSAMLNTYKLKEQLFGMVGKRFTRQDGSPHTRLILPRNVSEDFLEQSSSEYLAKGKGGKRQWRHKGPNHWSDCNVMAYGAALNLDPFQQGKTRDELVKEAGELAEADRRRRGKEREPSDQGRDDSGNKVGNRRKKGSWQIGRRR